MSQLEVDKVIPQSGTTLTLGESGDTISIPSGVTFNTASATVNYPAGSITNAAINSTAAIQQSKILGSPGFRNIVINGAMSIAQRATSVASITATGYYTVDRMALNLASLGTWTQSQSTDTPTGQGFASSLKMDCTTANASPASGDFFQVRQIFEGQNLQYLKKGTANAVQLTASFWVKSTKTGTFICELRDFNNTRSISAVYTVSVTNTWEKKIITFPGDTTGAFTNDNNVSLALTFWLGAGTDFTSGTLNTIWDTRVAANVAVGQVNIADDTANEWYITGVQLEAGTSASDFESLPVDVNLARCQRYYYRITPGAVSKPLAFGSNSSTTAGRGAVMFPVEMRVAPTALEQSGTANEYSVSQLGIGATTCSSVPVFNQANTRFSSVSATVASGLTQFNPMQIFTDSTNGINAFLAWSAEL